MKRTLPGLLVSLVALVFIALGTPFAGGRLTGTITNSTDTASVSVFGNCTSEAVSDNAYVVLPLGETSGTTAADVSGNGRNGTYSTTGVTKGVAGPCPRNGSKGVTLNGLTGFVYGTAIPSNQNGFTTAIWFKTTTTLGGKLIGLGNSQSGQSTQYDRHIYMSNDGTLNFGVYPNAVQVVSSTKKYNDGQWHLAVASLGPAGNANPGMRLYVDGALVASNATQTAAETDSGTMYLRVGYDNMAAWGSTQPTSNFFAGSVAYAEWYTSVLTPADISDLYYAGV